MFEDILGKDKKYVKTTTCTLHINDKEHNVKVFNVAENDIGTIEGYIRDNTLTIGGYTNYMIQMPGQSLLIKVKLLRVNKYTLKFYTEVK